MNYRLEFQAREAIRTVSLAASNSTLREAEISAQRLRSWAMMRDVPIAGAPILAVRPGDVGRVHLPISADCFPHPQTGIQLDHLPARPEIVVPGVRFTEIANVERALRESCEVEGQVEFHSVDRDFLEGELRVAGRSSPDRDQKFLALDRDAAIKQATESPESEPVAVAARPSIAIAYQPHSGGEAIAAALAARLGYELVDDGALAAAAASPGISVNALASSNTRRGFFQRAIEQMSHISPLAEYPLAPTQAPSIIATRQDCHRRWNQAISVAGRRGRTVVAARGATFALAAEPSVMRILITAPAELRSRRLVDSGASARVAARTVLDADRDIAQVIDEYYETDWLSATNYDLVVNIDRLDFVATADFIAHLAVQFFSSGSGRSSSARAKKQHQVPVTSIPFGISVPAPSL